MTTLHRQLLRLLFWLCAGSVSAQYSDGMTGLLHTPSAEMQPDGTFMIGGGFLNKELTPNTSKAAWSYHTYNYYLNVTLFQCLEIGYIMTLFKRGVPGIAPEVKFRGQDRHFSVRLRVLKEGQFWRYMPAVVLGAVDPLTNFHSPEETGNGHFNRYYIAATKHFDIPYGELGVHLSWNYRNRKDYRINAPGIGVSYDLNAVKGLRLIAEYDAKDIYFGAHYRVWRYLLLQAMMQRGQYFSGGVSFLLPLKK
jgi:hypothetical protein